MDLLVIPLTKICIAALLQGVPTGPFETSLTANGLAGHIDALAARRAQIVREPCPRDVEGAHAHRYEHALLKRAATMVLALAAVAESAAYHAPVWSSSSESALCAALQVREFKPNAQGTTAETGREIKKRPSFDTVV
eukprot:CAMPEP_0197942660 /NCGR_PEP_ID=MMETSP1439-20131203/124523_1 /TAXON_ID=66791 /ORGANISM="Gonyaulax spinifera, Strain CCMP409" /LENGTH=136 /DNA_ID=CAMNT_0043565917 /DNA_START=1015 /DNA_END=1427 /DNA_ORIENTATION=+